MNVDALTIQPGERALVTCDNWFYAPDGQQYRAVFGTVKGIRTAEETLGVQPRGPSTNWYLVIGNMTIAGCQIHYAVRCDSANTEASTIEMEHDGALRQAASLSKIYDADNTDDLLLVPNGPKPTPDEGTLTNADVAAIEHILRTGTAPRPAPRLIDTPWGWDANGYSLRPAVIRGGVTCILDLEHRGMVQRGDDLNLDEATAQLDEAYRAIELVPAMVCLLDEATDVGGTAKGWSDWRNRVRDILTAIRTPRTTAPVAP